MCKLADCLGKSVIAVVHEELIDKTYFKTIWCVQDRLSYKN